MRRAHRRPPELVRELDGLDAKQERKQHRDGRGRRFAALRCIRVLGPTLPEQGFGAAAAARDA